MSVNKTEVERIAELAKLNFNEEELEDLTFQLNKILEYMDKLNELDTRNVEPLSHPIESYNAMREDKTKPSINREDGMKNSPDNDGVFFRVPKVIGGD